MEPKIIHQFDHRYRCEYWVEGIKHEPVMNTLQEAIDHVIAIMHKHFRKTIVKDDIKYWEWSMALDVVTPYSIDRGLEMEAMIKEQTRKNI